MGDPRLDSMLQRCRARAGLPPTCRVRVTPPGASAATVTRALLPLMDAAAGEPIERALPHSVADFRVEGRANDAALGYFVESHPYGGGVIEGYLRVYRAALAGGVELAYPLGGYEDGSDASDDDGAASVWGDDPAAVGRVVAALGGAVVPGP